jgi:hypothetical protein
MPKIENFLSFCQMFGAVLPNFFLHFQNLAEQRHFEKGDHSQMRINYILLDRPTVSLRSNVNIVSVMLTGVIQCWLTGDLNWVQWVSGG